VNRRTFATAAPLSLFALPASAQLARISPGAPAATESDAIAKLAAEFMQAFQVPGLSVAVGHDDRLLYADAWGLADREKNERLTVDHRMRIASVSKPMTSVALFTLIERGALRLADRVFGPGALLDRDFGSPPYHSGIDRITVEHLLTHTAGGWPNDHTDPMFANLQMGHAELIALTLKTRPLDHAPGEHFAYSNFGFCVLGRVIEKVTRQRYAEFVQGAVLKRCGIEGMMIGGNTLADRQRGEVRYYNQDKFDAYGMNVTRMDSHGGWIARPSDLVRFALHVGRFDTPGQILRPETTRVMTSATQANAAYAKGWHVNRLDNWWHTGSLPGTQTFMARIHSGFCWAAFMNTRPTNAKADLDGLMWKMVRQVKGWRA
jgi:CubicO group peptidase (beta-lactamase class C family)